MKKYIKEFLPYVLIIIIVLLIKTYIVSPIRVNGSSMEKTLHDGDIMLLNEITYRFNDIKRFDIVVIHLEDEYIIKRVIGLPGDKVEYKNNKLYVNGKYIKESFSHEETEDFNIEELGSKKVPSGQYFVLGDNRMNSYDSRMIGFIDEDDIRGKAEYFILPFNKFGKKA